MIRFCSLLISLIGVLTINFNSEAQEGSSPNMTCSHKKHNALCFKKNNKFSQSDTLDILNFEINLNVTDYQNQKIKGNCVVTFVSLLDNVSSIPLDLLRLNIDSIKHENTTLSYSYNDTLLTVNLGQTLNSADTFSVTVYYNGKPQKDASWGGFYFQGNYAYNMGVGFDANPHNYGRVWFPCFDNFVERATFEFNILTTGGKKAFCNGELIKDSIIGTDSTLRTWKINEPIPTYLACIAVANYKTISQTHNGLNGSIPILLAAEATDTTNLKNSFKNLGNAIGAYENNYGPYMWNKVGYSLVPFDAGAMEHATNITYPRYAANGSLTYETLMAHELSHHWWGNLVTCRSAEDMWINEGMASFSEYLFTESVYGKDAYINAIKNDLNNVLHGAHIREKSYMAISGIPHEYTYGEHVYTKGALVAHSLRGYLGDSLFSSGLTSFLTANKFKGVSSYDLRDHLSIATGKDLTNFFDNWVFNGGFAHFDADSILISPSGNNFNAKVFIKQKIKGAPDFFKNVPLEIMFMDALWNKHYENFTASEESTVLDFILPFNPVYWEVNPNQKICQAVSNNKMTIKSTGNYNFDLARMVVNVSSITDSAYINISHHWVAPDEFINPVTNFKISDYRYWTVEGIFPQKFSASTKLYYDGRTSLSGSNGYLDNTFLGPDEDSVVLLHRKDASHEWTKFPYYTQNKLGSNTLKYGYMDIDSLIPGQYTFGYGDKTGLGIGNLMKFTDDFIVYPNPTSTSFTYNYSGSGSSDVLLCVFDKQGKAIYEKSIKSKASGTIDTTKWSSGIYIVKVKTDQGELSEKLVLSR